MGISSLAHENRTITDQHVSLVTWSGRRCCGVVKVVDLDSLVAAIAAQPAQTQACCASLMVANAFFFAAMKAVFMFPQVLAAVLDDIHLQVSARLCRPGCVPRLRLPASASHVPHRFCHTQAQVCLPVCAIQVVPPKFCLTCCAAPIVPLRFCRAGCASQVVPPMLADAPAMQTTVRLPEQVSNRACAAHASRCSCHVNLKQVS